MNWSRFPPSILALGKGYAIVLSLAFGSIKTVKVGIQTYGSFTGATNTSLVFFQEPAVVQHTRSSEPCPTCLQVDMDDDLLDYPGRALGVDHVMSQASGTPLVIGATHLTINYTPAQNYTTTSTAAVPSELGLVSSGTSWFETMLFFLDMLITCLMSRTSQIIFQAVNAATSRAMSPQRLSSWLVILQRLAAMLLSWPVANGFKFQRRQIDEAAIRNTEILENEKRKINRIANKSFKALRKAQEQKLIETYERDVLATANIEPSFGPSLRNAEAEIRDRLRPFEITENVREDLAGVFKAILYSFAYAIAVQESLSGVRYARYLSVIDGQNSLMEALRLMLKHREEAYAETESLIRLLCRYDKNGKLIIPDGQKNLDPFEKYSPRDDKFILSPLDGPAALSMKVSLSSAGFQSRPDALLDSDPDWQRFLKSIDRKREEQEVRHASAETMPMEGQVQVNHGIEDGDSEQIVEEEYPNRPGLDSGNGNKDVSEQNHHDGEIAAALHRPRETLSQQSESSGSLKEDEAKDETQYHTGRDVSSLKWQIRYLKAGYGTPDDLWAKPYSDAAPPATSEGLTGDELLARELWIEELAIWRKETILGFEEELAEQEIGNLSVGHGLVAGASGDTGSDNGDVGNGESQSPSDPSTDVSIQPHEAKHQPKEPSKTEKRRIDRKRAKAQKAKELLDSNNEA